MHLNSPLCRGGSPSRIREAFAQAAALKQQTQLYQEQGYLR
jgi:hypothetical protein